MSEEVICLQVHILQQNSKALQVAAKLMKYRPLQQKREKPEMPMLHIVKWILN